MTFPLRLLFELCPIPLRLTQCLVGLHVVMTSPTWCCAPESTLGGEDGSWRQFGASKQATFSTSPRAVVTLRLHSVAGSVPRRESPAEIFVSRCSTRLKSSSDPQ